jgi:hypothetical protein
LLVMLETNLGVVCNKKKAYNGGLMPLLTNLEVNLDVDRVLRAQGGDPVAIRGRSMRLVETAVRALKEGLPLIDPVVAYQTYRVKRIQHERMELSGDKFLHGKGIVKMLSGSEKIVVLLTTIGISLETYTRIMLEQDPSYGLALDGVGTAAIEALSINACSLFGEQAEAEGKESTIPFNPGIEEWTVEEGQRQIFNLINPSEAGISLTSSGMMVPQKSLSQVIGIGENVDSGGRICDYCSLRMSCRYQDQYA